MISPNVMNLINKPLSSKDIADAIPGVTVLKYNELCSYDSLPLPLVVLYETEPNYGHWVAVLETPDGIEHFDSYGIIPDNELKWINPKFRSSSGQDVKCLLKMLYESRKPVNYNSHRLQGRDSSTCGRWAILRILFSDLGSDSFAKAIKKTAKKLRLKLDDLVCLAVPV